MSPLRRRMIEDMQIRNLSGHTQRAYVEQVVRFARYFRRSPEHLGPPEIRTGPCKAVGFVPDSVGYGLTRRGGAGGEADLAGQVGGGV